MNEKQVKLLRYLVKETKDIGPAAFIKKNWHKLNHRQKGKLMRQAKKTIVLLMAIKDAHKKRVAAANSDVLKGFTT